MKISLNKILISFLFLYGFYADILIYFTNFQLLKTSFALIIVLLASIDITLNFKKYKNKRFLLIPLLIILLYLAVWQDLGYLNLWYTIIFGWILTQNNKFTMKVIYFTFIIFFILVIYEVISGNLIYLSGTTGVLNTFTYDYGESIKFFSSFGFRPKGLFTGTLVATSFIIYLTMFYRNNLRLLLLIFLMAVLVNGRLAMIVSFLTLMFLIMKTYNSKYQKLPLIFKTLVIFIFTSPLIFGLISILPKTNLNFIMNTFNFEAASNAGRIYSYGESIFTFLSYNFKEKLFGLPGNEIFDIYGRIVASESGLLSMFLDIGIIGVIFYFYFFLRAWLSDNSSIINLKSKTIGFKYVVLIMFISFLQYEHINGNQRGMLFWFIILSQLTSKTIGPHLKSRLNTVIKK